MSKKKFSKRKNDINTPNTLSSAKIIFVFVLILLLVVGLIIRLARIQFIDGPNLQTMATSQQTLTETITAKRGNIYDSKGQTLAISYYSDKVYFSPSNVKDENKDIISQNLSSILGLDYNELLNQITSATDTILIASGVNQDKVTEITDWKDKLKFKTGISFEQSTDRAYPRNSLASTVIGFVGTDNQGLAGIESSCDTLLSGTAGKSVSLKDASQSQIVNSEQTYIAAENGYDINLTLDVNIQTIVEKHLAEAVENYKCESGITIAMDPSTGKILALADYPNYNCNEPFTIYPSLQETWDTLSKQEQTNSLYNMWKPKAVTDLYEPGSVFKIITSSIALEESITETDKYEDYFTCTGSVSLEGESRPIKCFRYPKNHGKQTLRLSLEHSCNPSYINLGLRIGAKTSYKYYEAYGFFNKTGVGLSGEPKNGGIFYDINQIKPIELAVMSFGQRFSITPLQMITAASTIANDGVLVQPQIIDKITNTDTGEVTTFQTKEIRQVISKETADKVTSMMESVVNDTKEGTGVKGNVSGYSIGGKTGTSEPVYSKDENGYVASFLAISPVENTKIVLLVILKSPGPGVNHNGGQIAAPTASKMLTEILPYMNVESGSDDVDNSSISDDDLY